MARHDTLPATPGESPDSSRPPTPAYVADVVPAPVDSPPRKIAKSKSRSRSRAAAKRAAKSKHAHDDWQPHPLMRAYRKHQIDAPLVLLGTLLALHFFAPNVLPSLGLPPALAFIYPTGVPDPKGTGHLGKLFWHDVAFVLTGIFAWTLARASTIQYALKPLARKLKVRRALVDRFGEQGWLVVYYTVSFVSGISYVVEGKYFQDTRNLWRGYPRAYIPTDFKAYFLLQLAFWIQQLFVIHVEKPRKDHWQMLTHHVVTIHMVAVAYMTNFTRAGNCVLAYLDAGDIFLCLAKCLNYARFRKACDATFAFFVLVWVYSRHYLYLVYIIPSVLYEVGEEIDWTWDPDNGNYACNTMWFFFIGTLVILQVLLLMWLYLIVRVILKVVRGKGAEDNRSDDEDDEGGVETDAEEHHKAKADGGAVRASARADEQAPPVRRRKA